MVQGLLQFWIICIIGVTGTHNFLRSKIESDALIKVSFFKRKPFFSSSFNKIEKSYAKISVSTLSLAATIYPPHIVIMYLIYIQDILIYNFIIVKSI